MARIYNVRDISNLFTIFGLDLKEKLCFGDAFVYGIRNEKQDLFRFFMRKRSSFIEMLYHMIKDKNSHNLKKPQTGVTMPKQKPTLYSGKLSDV